MQNEENEHADVRLKEALRAWQVGEPLPPRFQEGVWKRIEVAEARPTRASISWLAALFRRPAFATGAAGLLLVAGLAAGYLRADHDATRWEEQLAHRYVTSLNPYASDHP